MPDQDELTPRERMAQGYAALLAALQTAEATDPEVIAIRAELAVAAAEAGEVDAAYFQAEDLLKDARRAHGEEHEATVRAREAQAQVNRIAGIGPA